VVELSAQGRVSSTINRIEKTHDNTRDIDKEKSDPENKHNLNREPVFSMAGQESLA